MQVDHHPAGMDQHQRLPDESIEPWYRLRSRAYVAVPSQRDDQLLEAARSEPGGRDP